MDYFQHQEKLNPKKLRILYGMGFLLSVSTAILAYIRSSYIEVFIDTKYLGLVFAAANFAAFTVIAFFLQIIKKYGRFKTVFILLWLNMLGLFFLALLQSFWIGFFIFIFYITTLWLVWIGYDIFMENYSLDAATGRIRGFAYTLCNLGWLISPFLAGVLLERYGFSLVFLIAGFLMLPIVLLFKFNFQTESRVELKDHFIYKFLPSLREIYLRKQIFKIFCIGFLLDFFYAWMVIYTPIHLKNLGMTWSEIGFTFTVMLLPFVLFQYLTGWLADKFFGEKELLSVGFIIMGLFTFSLFFIKTPSLFIWSILLFATRIGASLVEIMKDSYFFKQIDFSNTNLMVLFRNTLPLAYIISSLIAVFILYFFPLRFLFLFLGLFMFLGLNFSLRLIDTK
jgi:MFS family permease